MKKYTLNSIQDGKVTVTLTLSNGDTVEEVLDARYVHMSSKEALDNYFLEGWESQRIVFVEDQKTKKIVERVVVEKNEAFIDAYEKGLRIQKENEPSDEVLEMISPQVAQKGARAKSK